MKTRRKTRPVQRRETKPVEPRRCVALVEDDDEFRAIVARWLQAEFDTMSFPDGASLLAAADDEVTPDLIITDVKMPGINGYALCQEAHAHPRFAGVPVLFVTGVDSDEGFLLGLDAGGASYMTKPVERTALLARVRELVRPKMIA